MIVPRLRSPIVLVHGVLGFGELRLGRWVLTRYFRDIPAYLRTSGNRVLVAQLSPTASIAQRAAQLKRFIREQAGTEPVHIIGHSMGGLDSRYLISCLGMASQVLSLTTLGTPHRGSPFADWGMQRFERIVRPLCNFFHIAAGAFYDLTPQGCQRFNEAAVDVPGVRYFSVAAHWERRPPNPLWELPYRIVYEREGPNDGVVSVESARYGESTELWEGDHVSLINWYYAPGRSTMPDRHLSYGGLVRRLADEGF